MRCPLRVPRRSRVNGVLGDSRDLKAAVVTTPHARDQSGCREAQPAEVLDRAQALLAQRYRVGSPSRPARDVASARAAAFFAMPPVISNGATATAHTGNQTT